MTNLLYDIFPITRSILGADAWSHLMGEISLPEDISDIPDIVKTLPERCNYPDYFIDLLQVELLRYQVGTNNTPIRADAHRFTLNPTLHVHESDWHFSGLLNDHSDGRVKIPIKGSEWLLIWRDPVEKYTKVRAAIENDLLAIKILAEGFDLTDLADTSELNIYQLKGLLQKGADIGYLLSPPSGICRTAEMFPIRDDSDNRFIRPDYFTLQWHITQSCDLHCKHCYDRSRRSHVNLDQGRDILLDLHSFCWDHHVKGHVCFSGGNPLLHPQFMDLYKAATEMGFSTSILGNPGPRDIVENIAAIQIPSYFQCSLEGLPEHNDSIRGAGQYYRVIEFLGVLRDVGIPPAIMLTVTRENMDQVIPLAERLRGHAEQFTFNRLSPVGEGANLLLPEKDAYQHFIKEYCKAAESNPIMGLKDNLINIIRDEEGSPPFGGCAGYGCGAAFNFLAVLPDGEVHACRKFPSKIGNLYKNALQDIYYSDEAASYRKGTTACLECSLRSTCGGCLAIIDGFGGDIKTDLDPYCFRNNQTETEMRE